MSEEEDKAARVIVGFFRALTAQSRFQALIRQFFVKRYDAESGYYYYENTKTGETSWSRPRNLKGEDDLVEAHGEANAGGAGGKTGAAATAAAAVAAAEEEQPAAPKTDVNAVIEKLERERREKEEQKKREEEEQRRKVEEAKRLVAEKAAEKERNRPRAPRGVGCKGGMDFAAVWWTPGHPGPSPIAKYTIVKFRLEQGKWARKKVGRRCGRKAEGSAGQGWRGVCGGKRMRSDVFVSLA